MTEQQKETFDYDFTRTINADFEQAIDRTHEALKQEGFRVLSGYPIDENLKEKLGFEFRRYLILGECNSSLAYKTIQDDKNNELFLPCSVVVFESDENNQSVVEAFDAKKMTLFLGLTGIESIADEVNERLKKALENI